MKSKKKQNGNFKESQDKKKCKHSLLKPVGWSQNITGILKKNNVIFMHQGATIII